jgi:hypothetical protein
MQSSVDKELPKCISKTKNQKQIRKLSRTSTWTPLRLTSLRSCSGRATRKRKVEPIEGEEAKLSEGQDADDVAKLLPKKPRKGVIKPLRAK